MSNYRSESETKKYTLLESGAIFGLLGVAMPLLIIAFIPLYLMTAWMRSVMWSWFAVPYLHLPPVDIWPMFGIGLLVSAFSVKIPSLKKEMYDSGLGSRIASALIGEWVVFGLAYAIHHWILKG